MAKMDKRFTAFEKNDIISFAGDKYTVRANHGNSGAVQPMGEEGVICPFYWRFEGEDCVLVSKGDVMRLFAVAMLLQDPTVKLTKMGEFEGRMVVNHAWASDHDVAKVAVAQKIQKDFSEYKISAVTIHEIEGAIHDKS